jgi:hypothetical protein
MGAQNEAAVIINGVVLTPGESMTLRVAVESLALYLAEDGLGDDELGREMLVNYGAAIIRIRRAFHRGVA